MFQGDEPFHSDDSNLLGPVRPQEFTSYHLLTCYLAKVPAALVESKLVFILWPPNRFGRLQKPDLPLAKNGPVYRHAMALFEKDLSRKARVTRDPLPVKINNVSSSTY